MGVERESCAVAGQVASAGAGKEVESQEGICLPPFLFLFSLLQ